MSSGRYRWLAEVESPRDASADVPSASATYRHTSANDVFAELEVSNLYELFTRSVDKFPNNPCLGERSPDEVDGTMGPYVFKTFKEVANEVALLASGLRAIGAAPKSRVGVFGANCPEWMMAMQACNRMSMLCVPLYDTLAKNALEYIINHSETMVAFVSTEKLPKLVLALEKTKEVLKAIVYWGAGDAESIQAAKALGYQVFSFEELKQKGTDSPAEAVPPSADDLCTIMYTSGTMGAPKGVMLKHSAVIAAVANCEATCRENNLALTEQDSMLSYLPLAHIFDRVFEEFFLYLGGSIGYWQGDVTQMLDDINELKPTVFIGVPRVFDRIHSRVMAKVNGNAFGTVPFIQRNLFYLAYMSKRFFMQQGWKQDKAFPYFDRHVFSKVAAALGGRVKVIVSGGAPLSPQVEDFLRVTMCCPVVQGYGLTETCAASTIAIPDEMSQASTVGPPTPCTEIRLESVPEMNYDALAAREPKGELLIRGPANFSGYYKDHQLTEEVVDKDGWFHTGDIACLTKDGALKIIDRKKNIFKLSQGEYVSAERLEAIYKANPLLEQVFVYGNSFESCLVAVVVPSRDRLVSWMLTKRMPSALTDRIYDICRDPKIKTHILSELAAMAKAEKLKGYEYIKAVHLEPTMFTVEDNLLTPTFKLKRPQLTKKYQKILDKMYKDLKS